MKVGAKGAERDELRDHPWFRGVGIRVEYPKDARVIHLPRCLNFALKSFTRFFFRAVIGGGVTMKALQYARLVQTPRQVGDSLATSTEFLAKSPSSIR